jgi:hypothetical protein
MNQMVRVSPTGVTESCEDLCSDIRAHLARSAPQSSGSSATYSACGGGHGGTRNRSISRKVQTWSVNPAAIAGVQGRHWLAEPAPWVGRGCGQGRRRLAWGKQKL